MFITSPLFLSGLALVLFVPFALWFIRHEYRLRKKLSWSGAIIHVAMFAVHGVFSGMTAWGPGEIPPISPGGEFGLALMIIGLILTLWAMDVFRTFSRWLGNNTPGLKDSGLYRFSRNPQFVGYGLLLTGFFLAWRTPLNIAAFLAYLLIARETARVEEEHLKRTYGQAYQDYLARVHRFFGRPRPSPGS